MMAAQSSREIVKRGYLYDKKGILDRKRWYVLWRASGTCAIDIFKDERAAAKMETPKSSIDVHEIVQVRRVVDRKQSFEILCPGLGYRFMANSEVEADEWVASIAGLILYRKEPPPSSSSSFSLPRHTSPMTIISPSHNTLQPYYNSDSLHRSPSSCSGLPTPPEHCHHLHHRRNSAESAPYSGPVYTFPPAPSPPSSSSGSSMASGSHASCDPAVGADQDIAVKFRVHVKESDNLSISGPVDLVLGDGKLSLQSPDTGSVLVSWPIAALRRYGAGNVSVTIVTGRNCLTGAGKFQFYTPHSRRVYSHLHAMAVSKAAASKTIPIYRTGSEPGPPLSQPSPPPCSTTPVYEQSLSVPSSTEEYTNWLPPPTTHPRPHQDDDDDQTPQFTSTLC